MGENGLKYRHVVFRIDSPTVMLGDLFNGAVSNVVIKQSRLSVYFAFSAELEEEMYEN
jgi:hypothetical protein